MAGDGIVDRVVGAIEQVLRAQGSPWLTEEQRDEIDQRLSRRRAERDAPPDRTGARPWSELGDVPDVPADVLDLVRDLRLRGQQERFRAAWEQSKRTGERADQAVDERLQATVERPLVGEPGAPNYERRPTRRPWAEMTPTRNVLTYSEDDVNAGRFWTPERRARTQQMLVNAGLLDGEFRYGLWDEATADAYRDLLTVASQAGQTATEALLDIQRARKWARENGVDWRETVGLGDRSGEGAGRRVFPVPRYDPPDPAAVAQVVGEMFRSRLGRRPTGEELQHWASTFMTLSREQHDAEVAMERADFDQAGAGSAPAPAPAGRDDVFDASMPTAPPGGAAGGVTVAPAGPGIEQVDAGARFAQAFDAAYRAEEDTYEARPAPADLSGLLAGVTRMTG